MNWLFRPSILVLVSTALAVTAGAVVLWPRSAEMRALPEPVPDGDREIVWLYAATNAAPWERFVSAVGSVVRRLRADHSDLALEVHDAYAFPRHTTAVPELALSVRGNNGRLLFRWYKLTSDLKTQDWVKALLERRPAPLAIIGGSSSDLAIELANSLKQEAARQALGPAAPLLLLTTATANDDSPAGEPVTSIYPARTFRFCFTNRQMAEAVIDFIWSRSDLRPDRDPLYSTFWDDDPYSKDLNWRFCDALRLRAARAEVEATAREWAGLGGFAAIGGFPLDLTNVCQGQFRMSTPFSRYILYSVGTFDRPNQWEMEAAREIMDAKLSLYRAQRRPLLVVPAASQPARRFLRALERIAPLEARRFVVATGDAIAFNIVYRDRNVTWPIQDLPFPLVFFCHRNPVDHQAGFAPENDSPSGENNGNDPPTTGTEDLLLFADIVDALFQAGYQDTTLAISAGDLRQRLSQARWLKNADHVGFGPGGEALFDEDGNRRSGTGEHVVFLQPDFKGKEVAPHAQIEVWSWQPGAALGQRWSQRKVLAVEYEGYSGHEAGE